MTMRAETRAALEEALADWAAVGSPDCDVASAARAYLAAEREATTSAVREALLRVGEALDDPGVHQGMRDAGVYQPGPTVSARVRTALDAELARLGTGGG